MKTNVLFLVDGSYSVKEHGRDYLEIVNSVIDAQKQVDMDSRMTFATFNHDIHYKIVNQSIRYIPEVTMDVLNPVGGTSMRDCIATTISKMLKFTDTIEGVEKIVIILTDGDDTSSRFVSQDLLSKQIILARKYGWKFIFLGVTKESMEVGRACGFNICVRYDLSRRCKKYIWELTRDFLNNFHENDADLDIRSLEEEMNEMKIE